MVFSLFKIFASNIFSFANFFEGMKKGWKGILKTVLLSLFLLYCYGVILFIYGVSMFSVYKYMSSIGYTSLMPLVAVLGTFFIILFFGITSVTSNYYTASGEEQIISMPVSSAQIFGAKFAVSFFTDAVIGFILFAISAFIYGYNEHLLKNPLFYLGFFVTDISLSVFSITIIYLILIFILSICPSLRKKSFLTSIATFLLLVFAFSYGMLSSKLSGIFNGNFEQIDFFAGSIGGFLIGAEEKHPVLLFTAEALNGKILPILIMVVFTSAILFGLIPLMGKFYIKTLNGFSDIKAKKISAVKMGSIIKKDTRSKSIFNALYLRDLRTVLREPTFFANGPLMVFLFPIIILISLIVEVLGSSSTNFTNMIIKFRTTLSEMSIEKIQDLKYYFTLILAGLSYLAGNMSNIASSSFSREGKGLYDLKAMPIENRLIAKVKFWHSLTYVLLGWVIISLLFLIIDIVLAFPFSAFEQLSIYFYSLISILPVSILLIFIDMFIDTAKPKLQWENPIAAFKQNMNTVGAVFISFTLLVIIIILYFFVLPKTQTAFIIEAVIFTIISAPIGSAYFKYAEKRITKM